MLHQKTVVITGGTGGIGKETAILLASQGANIALLYSSAADAAEEICTCIRQTCKTEAAAYACDVSDFKATRLVISDIQSRFGNIHVLVNNAGITADKLALSMTEHDYDAVLGVNLKGSFNMIRHILPSMFRNREGCIINISSVSGLIGNAGQSNYAASKAGLIGLTKSIAREYASRNIRCNAVAPGFIQTDMTASLDRELLKRRIPLGRPGMPADVAHAISYLIQAPYVTGEVLRVDGGLAM